MVKHIVLFKLRDDVDAATKESELKAIKAGLEALQGIAPTLRSIEVGININANEKYNLALTCTFDDMEGLNAYAVHPEHVKVSQRIRAILDQRACVDYLL
ncbi:MAG: Dabb family protein [Marinilabiliaceae bacterium]|jgi:hypothetical protein|nr:Dabb family protein [Bacteroidales bacterium]MCR5695833.1 Dabb family protein [Marinilabiliaceae bacterium]